MSEKNRIIKGAFTLFAAGAAVKILGLIFKIPLQYLLGDTGMGYFNVAYNIYAWFYIISTAGLPVSVSVNVARANADGNMQKCKVIFRCAVTVFSLFGSLCSVIMAVFCRTLAAASSVINSVYCIAAVAPSVLFGCISSAVRGYYQGFGIMWPSAVSQVIEAFGKLAFGLIFALISSYNGAPPHIAAAYAILGVTCGTACSALFCITVKLFYRRIRTSKNCVPLRKTVINELLKTALPVTVSSAVMNLTGLIDVFAAPSRLLKIGYSEAQSTEIFGNYTTLAVPMMNLPLIFVYPITSAALPVLTAEYAKGCKQRIASVKNSLYKPVLMISLPCAIGLSVMAGPVLSLIFNERSAQLAAPMLAVLAPASALCALLAASDTVLSAKYKAHYTVISMLAGSIVKFISTSFLMTVIGRIAIPAGTCLCYLTALMINLLLSREKSVCISFNDFIKPALSGALCGISAFYVYKLSCQYLSNDISCAVSVASAAAIYFASLYISGYFEPEQIKEVLEKFKKRKSANDRI